MLVRAFLHIIPYCVSLTLSLRLSPAEEEQSRHQKCNCPQSQRIAASAAVVPALASLVGGAHQNVHLGGLRSLYDLFPIRVRFYFGYRSKENDVFKLRELFIVV